MKVSLNIMLMELSGYRKEIHVKQGKNLVFSMCLPLSGREKELDRSCLYIGDLSTALKMERNDAVVICRRDRLQDELETEETLSNIIVINENIATYELLCNVQKFFFEVIAWKHTLDEALMRECTCQELVELCPPILGNFIEVTDSAFKLMAQTTQFDCDDPICQGLRQNGYHTEQTVAAFRRANLFEVWERNNDIFYDPSTDVAKYPSLHKVFKFHGSYYAHCVMLMNNIPVSDGITDLFRIFVNALAICIERDWENNISCVHPYDNLISDIFTGNTADIDNISKRAAYIALPLTGNFYVIRVRPKYKNEVPFGTMMRDFGETLSYVKYIFYNESIVAIYNETAANSIENTAELLRAYAARQNCICGISSRYTSLVDAKPHLDEADLAIKYSRILEENKGRYPYVGNSGGSGVVFFDDIYPYCALGEGEAFKDVWYNSRYHGILKELYMHDAEHQTCDIRMLREILENQGQITLAAQIVNMHRNSIVYRMQRINEIYGIDMNRSSDRRTIDVSLKLVELYGFK